MHPLFAATAARVVHMGARAASQGWAVATGGNFSARIDGERIAITATGTDKGALTLLDILEVHLQQPLPPRSSAEAPLHVGLYRSGIDVGAVYHLHSPYGILLSMELMKACDKEVETLRLEGYELLKAIAGVSPHTLELDLPVLHNSQDMEGVARRIPELRAKFPHAPAFLLAGHGLTAWGRTVEEAMRHGEALEFLFRLAWEQRRFQAS